MYCLRNAFVIEGPVPPELFFDRGEVVTFFRNLLELEKYKMLIAILGPFKFGKTSILLKLRSIASSYNKVIPLLLRLNIVSKPFTFIVKKLAEKIEGIDVEEVLRCEEPYYMFEKINIMLEKEDKWLLLLIDEFQDLPEAIKSEGFFINRQDKFIFEFVRGIVEEFRIGLVVSGSVIGPLMDALDVWHGRFIQFKLREFPREDSISMLRKLFDLSGMHADDSVLKYIAVSMNDHPFHMQLFGYYLVDQRNINEDTLEIARRKVQKILIDYYGRKLLEVNSIDPNATQILARMLQPISIAKLSDDEIDLVLKLERLGYVFRDNNEYRIYDKMFGRYITNVLSNRPKEKYIPEYTSEYIVAKKLAYE